MPSFELVGLPFEPFASLFSLRDSELRKFNARRVVAAANPGFPCRVSLADAEVGEELLLLPYAHQPAESPYKSSGPIYVRKLARQRAAGRNVIPDYVRIRVMSVRAYDAAHGMTDASVCDGADCASVIRRMFEDDAVEYIHLHNAARGCFSCAAKRVP